MGEVVGDSDPETPETVGRALQLSPAEKAAITRYTNDGHVAINADLRKDGDGDPAVLRDIFLLDAVFARFGASSDLTVYRGIDDSYARILEERKLRIGDVIIEPAFVSTSTERTVARRFMDFEPGGMILRIVVPKGASAIDVSPHSANIDECEWLLARGTEFVVKGYDAVADVLDLEVLLHG